MTRIPETMNVTRALAELKILEDRIIKAVQGTSKQTQPKFVGTKKKSSSIVNGVYDLDKFKVDSKASIQRFFDLQDRQLRIKSAIVASNANTVVTIAENVYTIAEALEYKRYKIPQDKILLKELESQYSNAVNTIDYENATVDHAIEKMYTALMGKESAVDEKFESKIFKEYRNTNEYELIDPINIEKYIAELRESIEVFEMNIDYVLSESNALTKITF